MAFFFSLCELSFQQPTQLQSAVFQHISLQQAAFHIFFVRLYVFIQKAGIFFQGKGLLLFLQLCFIVLLQLYHGGGLIMHYKFSREEYVPMAGTLFMLSMEESITTLST